MGCEITVQANLNLFFTQFRDWDFGKYKECEQIIISEINKTFDRLEPHDFELGPHSLHLGPTNSSLDHIILIWDQLN